MSGPIQLVNLLLSLLAFALIGTLVYHAPAAGGGTCPSDTTLSSAAFVPSHWHDVPAEGAVKTDLPEGFSLYAAYGDLAASILAFVALAAL